MVRVGRAWVVLRTNHKRRDKRWVGRNLLETSVESGKQGAGTSGRAEAIKLVLVVVGSGGAPAVAV